MGKPVTGKFPVFRLQIPPAYLQTASVSDFVLTLACRLCIKKQELSYRKQIARQLRTQYTEGIYRPKYYTVTLKSRLRVTQGHCHWKRNHWIDHLGDRSDTY